MYDTDIVVYDSNNATEAEYPAKVPGLPYVADDTLPIA